MIPMIGLIMLWFITVCGGGGLCFTSLRRMYRSCGGKSYDRAAMELMGGISMLVVAIAIPLMLI